MIQRGEFYTVDESYLVPIISMDYPMPGTFSEKVRFNQKSYSELSTRDMVKIMVDFVRFMSEFTMDVSEYGKLCKDVQQ